MKKFFLLILMLALVVAGCGQKKEATSREAINVAKTMETVEQKAEYLIGQAKAFYSSKEFQQAIKIAQYVLVNLDKDSQTSKDIIAKAKEALAVAARAALKDAKKRLGDLGK